MIKKVRKLNYLPEESEEKEEVKEETVEITKTPEKLFGMLFNIRDTVHLNHLASTSYSEHITLNDLYEEILPLIDELIESYQGCYEKVEIEIPASKRVDNILEFLQEAKETIVSNSYQFGESFLHNIEDEILVLISKTIYKLKYLK